MQVHVINGRSYYLALDLQKVYPSFFTGCKSVNEVVNKKKTVPAGKYIYAAKNNDIWIETNGRSRKFDRLLIRKRWFDSLNINVDNIEVEPEIIELEDHEKFKDSHGNMLDIEVRGTRDTKNCYFKVKDVGKGFGIDKINTILLDKTSNYRKQIHYKYFYSTKKNSPGKRKIKVLYLSYLGILRVLFTTRNRKVEHFVGWATDTLFTAQLGTREKKNLLVANMLGVSADAVRAVFDTNIEKIPCIYLFSIGTVKDLRKSLDIDISYKDTDIVYKYGMTTDLSRRAGEHKKAYGKLKGANVCLKIFNYIDPQYISVAETKIKNFMQATNCAFCHDSYKELAIIKPNPKTMKNLAEQFHMISKLYSGHITELIRKIQEKDEEIKLLEVNQRNDILQINLSHDRLLYEKDKMIAKLLLDHQYDISKKSEELNSKETEHQKILASKETEYQKILASKETEYQKILASKETEHQKILASKEAEFTRIINDKDRQIEKLTYQIDLMNKQHEIDLYRKKKNRSK